MGNFIIKKKFSDINLRDPFFDNLKKDYMEFVEWFERKKDEQAYVYFAKDKIVGFLYLKIEDDKIADITPALPRKKRLKIGTFKIEAHGTRLGERFIKKAIDHALSEGVAEIYLTIFPKHEGLIGILKEFGFEERGKKITANGEELVLLKNFNNIVGVPRKDFPVINARGKRKFLLAIKPEWHTKLFPDSILHNETYDIVEDVSHTNSIQKTYVCFMDLSGLQDGDILIIYRMKDEGKSAWYGSVVTSVCTVEQVKKKNNFKTIEEYLKYTEKFSVFCENELQVWWNRGTRLYVIKMLYNAAFSKRIIRKDLIEKIGLDGGAGTYWGFTRIKDEQFVNIMKLGGVNESVVVY